MTPSVHGILVGIAGLKPTTSPSQTARSIKLSYTPEIGTPSWIQTKDPSLIKQTLCH